MVLLCSQYYSLGTPVCLHVFLSVYKSIRPLKLKPSVNLVHSRVEEKYNKIFGAITGKEYMQYWISAEFTPPPPPHTHTFNPQPPPTHFKCGLLLLVSRFYYYQYHRHKTHSYCLNGKIYFLQPMKKWLEMKYMYTWYISVRHSSVVKGT